MKTVELYVMDNDTFQPSGVALYKNIDAIRLDLKSCYYNDYREQENDETGETEIISGDDFVNECLEKFLKLCRIEEFYVDKVPAEMYFSSASDYKDALVK